MGKNDEGKNACSGSARRADARDIHRLARHAVLDLCCSCRFRSNRVALTPSGRALLAGGVGLFLKPPAFSTVLHIHAPLQVQSPADSSAGTGLRAGDR